MYTHSPTLALVKQLITLPSITPQDQGCQDLLAQRLHALGFHCEFLNHGDVTNLLAIKPGSDPTAPWFAFAGHTDVVPAGDEKNWQTPPFTPTEQKGYLYGRGAADMKSSLAAIIVALEEFLQQDKQHRATLACLFTSDEEGAAIDGSAYIVEVLKKRAIQLDYCLVGEPTCTDQLGDTIKNGRRGSLNGTLIVKGKQGHIAYPYLALNPIHLIVPVLAEWTQTIWDQGNDDFSPTSWQISNIHAGTGVSNVIPANITVEFNFRFSTESSVDSLQTQIEQTLKRYQLSEYTLQWMVSGLPFLTPQGTFSNALCRAISAETGVHAHFSTNGGTSDGRFIATICQQVLEFGPINQTIHQMNESIAVTTLDSLKNIYRRVLEKLVRY